MGSSYDFRKLYAGQRHGDAPFDRAAGSTPAEFDALIRAEIEKWARVVKVSGAKAD